MFKRFFLSIFVFSLLLSSACSAGTSAPTSAPISGLVSTAIPPTPVPTNTAVPPAIKTLDPNTTAVIFLGKDGQLYSSLVNGKTVSTSRLTTGEKVGNFEITPNGQYVVYDTGFQAYSLEGLHSIPITGGSSTQIAQNASAWKISPDSKSVVYEDGRQFSVVSVQGGAPSLLTTDNISCGSCNFDQDVQVSPDSKTVVFRASSARNVLQLYLVQLDKSPITPTVLNGRMVSGGAVQGFVMSPDGKNVVYWADQNTQGTIQLFQVSVTGEQPAQLFNETLDAFKVKFETVAISPDSNYVLCIAYFPLQSYGAYDSGSLVSISMAKTSGPNVFSEQDTAGFQIAHNSTAAVLETGKQSYVYSFPIGGGKPTKLAGDKDSSFYGVVFNITPDDSHIVYREYNAFSVPTTGGTPISLMPDGYHVPGVLVSPDSKTVVMLVTYPNHVHNIYSRSVAGGNEAVKLNSALSSQSFKDFQIRITADSQYVLYTSDQDAAGYSDLFMVPISGGETMRLDSDESGGVVRYRVFPKGTDIMIPDQFLDTL